MTFDEKIRAYEAKTKRIEARGRATRNVLIGLSLLIATIIKLVAVLIH